MGWGIIGEEKDNKSLGNNQYLGKYWWNNRSHERVYYLFATVKLGKEKALFNFQISSINKHINPRGLHKLGKIYSLITVITHRNGKHLPFWRTMQSHCPPPLSHRLFPDSTKKGTEILATSWHFIYRVLKLKAPLPCQSTLVSSPSLRSGNILSLNTKQSDQLEDQPERAGEHPTLSSTPRCQPPQVLWPTLSSYYPNHSILKEVSMLLLFKDLRKTLQEDLALLFNREVGFCFWL